MRGLELEQQIKPANYTKAVYTGDDYDADDESELCPDDLREMQQADWLKSYKRLIRRAGLFQSQKWKSERLILSFSVLEFFEPRK